MQVLKLTDIFPACSSVSTNKDETFVIKLNPAVIFVFIWTKPTVFVFQVCRRAASPEEEQTESHHQHVQVAPSAPPSPARWTWDGIQICSRLSGNIVFVS